MNFFHKTIFFLILLFSFTIPSLVLAAPPLELQVPFGGTDSITLCQDAGNDLKCDGIAMYVAALYEWLIVAVAIVAVLALMYGGILWVSASGSQDKIKQAKTVTGNALVALALLLGSYIFLWAINPNLVTFGTLTLRTPKRIELEIKDITTGAKCERFSHVGGYGTKKGKSESKYSGSLVSSGKTETINGPDGEIKIWTSDAFKEGDAADVIYMFHGILNVPNTPRDLSYTYLHQRVPPIVGQLIASKKMGPVILVIPKDEASQWNIPDTEQAIKKLDGIAASVEKHLKDKKISIVTGGIAGHSNAGVTLTSLAKECDFKFIGLMDPYVSGGEDTIFSKRTQKSCMLMDYNVNNWGGYPEVRQALPPLARVVPNSASRGQNHFQIVLTQANRFSTCYAPE